jgi:hypothetical protein
MAQRRDNREDKSATSLRLRLDGAARVTQLELVRASLAVNVYFTLEARESRLSDNV